MDAYTFREIYDMDTLQKLIESLSAALQVGISIRSPEGERYTDDSDYCRLCREIKKSSIGNALCEESDLALCACESPSPCIRLCRSAGLTDAGIRLMVEDVHAATILVGQVLLKENVLSEEEYRQKARSLQIDEEEYLRQIRQIPQKTRAEFESILNAITLMAEQLSMLGRKNLYLKSIINALENQEIMHQKEKEFLEKLAETDSMTGLYNHRKFDEIFSQYASRTDMKICLISADANYLKLMNDVFGHDSGDLMLKNIARIMASLAKKEWLAARCGGDEFRIILPNTSLMTAQDYCRHVTRLCGEDRSLAFPLSVALGAAEWNSGTETLFECFTRADQEMYRNKAVLKQEQHIPDLMMERLYNRQILNRAMVELETKITYDFALYLGFSKEHAYETSMASHYQDIGMAKLPDYFVVRGQSKTEEEKLQIQAHTTNGYQIARQFEELYKIADIIQCSHENWDGNSYPKGLKGGQIPVEARILRITNNYAYWTLPTSSGTNHTKEEARQRLTRFSGVMYDPELVCKFIKFIDLQDY